MESSFSSSRGYSFAMIEDFQHVCITCRDLERSIRFYERLGLEVIEPVSELDEEAIARAFQTSRGHIRVLHLAPPNAPSKCSLIWCNGWILRPRARLTLQRTMSVSITSRFVYLILTGQQRLCASAASRFLRSNRNPSDRFEPFLPLIPMGCSFNSSNGFRVHMRPR
jgi:Glyoxalase/Bleomycin resistance protein/Dioxygenase superfamily